MRAETIPVRAAHAFDPRGRMSASAYRRFLVRTVLWSAVLFCLGIWLGSLGARWLALLAMAGILPVGVASLAATARRLHDRDRSAGWLAAWVTVQALGFAPLERYAETEPALVVVAVLAMLGFSVWFFLETVLRGGTPGRNRFGPAGEGA